MSYFRPNQNGPVCGSRGGGFGQSPPCRPNINYCNPNINTVRPSYNKYCRPATGCSSRNNYGKNGGGAGCYGQAPYGMQKPNETRWSFGGSGSAQEQQAACGNYTTVTKPMRVGRSASNVPLAKPYSSYQQQRSNSTQPKLMQPTASANYQNTAKVSTSQTSSNSVSEQLPAEGENVKYVKLNWEDILGGKEGINGLRVSMAPPTKDNPNRQLSIGFGAPGTEGQTASDGSVPLKVLKFEPVENYSGQMTPTTGSSTSIPTMTANAPLTQPNSYYGASSNSNSGGVSPQIEIMNSGNGGQPVIKLPPGYRIAAPSEVGNNFNYGNILGQQGQGPAVMMAMQGAATGNNNTFANAQRGSSCSCPACQFKQPTSFNRRR